MIISASLRRQVIERAGNRCEYCGLAQTGQEATFHIDHVVPAIVGGNTSLENLALACVSCSLRKGARLLVQDPHTREEVALFHPRLDSWRAHFRWDGLRAVGITPTGRATVVALNMNRPLALAIREEEAHRGRHPPQAHV
jgi:HNH endonuclease